MAGEDTEVTKTTVAGLEQEICSTPAEDIYAQGMAKFESIKDVSKETKQCSKYVY